MEVFVILLEKLWFRVAILILTFLLMLMSTLEAQAF
jgi:hypothetical protein